jgi:SAM-dependent methyltransferase
MQSSVETSLTDEPGRGQSSAEAEPVDAKSPPEGGRRKSLRQFYAWHLKPLVWRLLHPGGTPEEYYARSIAGRVLRGSHPAIGSAARSVRAPTELLDILLTHGLKPEHVVVDYGCGSFRLGKALIEYLAPTHYWGLDVIDEFLESGMALLEPELKSAKRPNARVINAGNLAETAAAKPDFVISWHVCSKVPPNRLTDYFGKIVSLLGPNGLALVHFPEADARRRQSRFSWAENRTTIAEALRKVDPRLEIRFVPVTDQISHGIRQTMVEISRPNG